MLVDQLVAQLAIRLRLVEDLHGISNSLVFDLVYDAEATWPAPGVKSERRMPLHVETVEPLIPKVGLCFDSGLILLKFRPPFSWLTHCAPPPSASPPT